MNAVLLALLTGACAPDRTTAARTIASCSWSFFGDPRSLVRDGHLITGCIRADGDAVVEDFELATGRRRLQTVVDGLEVDDHNNPSVVFDGRSAMRYPVSPGAAFADDRTRRAKAGYAAPVALPQRARGAARTSG